MPINQKINKNTGLDVNIFQHIYIASESSVKLDSSRNAIISYYNRSTIMH